MQCGSGVKFEKQIVEAKGDGVRQQPWMPRVALDGGGGASEGSAKRRNEQEGGDESLSSR